MRRPDHIGSTSAGGSGSRRGRLELRVVLKDCAFEALQLVARLEPELLVKQLAGVAVRSERLGLPAAAVQRQHEQRADALAQRVLLHERLELGDELGVSSKLQVGADPVLERGEAQLVEASDLDACERLVCEVGEGRTAPE